MHRLGGLVEEELVVLSGGTGYLTLSFSAPVVGMTRDTVRLRRACGRSRDRGAVSG
ncbi:hypothetical protein GCM10018777_42620 [Streptomyces albogriseolus]|uniref:hypothetical protein n=1 Tax=Streptomyces albogriseolus TaxID=1887 RepID=UPI001677182E|nr:hypothetical protein [Streptomyces viridodiastaticus]GHG23439.1 hypothetical protein GCM10018777_42620 [Streptomyces viridodiastaticus]